MFIVFYFDLLTLLLGKKKKEKKGVKTYIFEPCKLDKMDLYIVMPQFDWLRDVCGCVMSPTLGIYWVDLGFINNYKKPQ